MSARRGKPSSRSAERQKVASTTHESVSSPRCAARALRQRSSSLFSQPTRRSLTLILCGNLPARSKRPGWTLEKLMPRTGLSSGTKIGGLSTCVSSSEVHGVRGSRCTGSFAIRILKITNRARDAI